MTSIKPLMHLSHDDIERLIVGYTSPAVYRVGKEQSGDTTIFTVQLSPLPRPYHKRFADDLDAESIARYLELPKQGYSFGAYDGDRLIGLALAEPQQWNKTLWVWELHVAATHRRHGVGRALVAALVEKAQAAGLRAIVCETQNTNADAIHFYRRAGFDLDGIDLSYYTNSDYPDGEIAIFMKKKIN